MRTGQNTTTDSTMAGQRESCHTEKPGTRSKVVWLALSLVVIACSVQSNSGGGCGSGIARRFESSTHCYCLHADSIPLDHCFFIWRLIGRQGTRCRSDFITQIGAIGTRTSWQGSTSPNLLRSTALRLRGGKRSGMYPARKSKR